MLALESACGLSGEIPMKYGRDIVFGLVGVLCLLGASAMIRVKLASKDEDAKRVPSWEMIAWPLVCGVTSILAVAIAVSKR